MVDHRLLRRENAVRTRSQSEHPFEDVAVVAGVTRTQAASRVCVFVPVCVPLCVRRTRRVRGPRGAGRRRRRCGTSRTSRRNGWSGGGGRGRKGVAGTGRRGRRRPRSGVGWCSGGWWRWGHVVLSSMHREGETVVGGDGPGYRGRRGSAGKYRTQTRPSQPMCVH